MTYSATRLIGPAIFLATGVFLYVRGRSLRREQLRLDAENRAAGINFQPLERPLPWSRGAATALGLAAFYLLIFRIITLVPPFVWDDKGGPILMSLSFLFLGLWGL